GHGFAERPEPRPQRPVFISQLYCAPDMTGRGHGAALIEWAIAEARAWRADAVQLSVFSENHGAQRFYRRYGFGHVADIDFWVGNHRDHEFLYELALRRSPRTAPSSPLATTWGTPRPAALLVSRSSLGGRADCIPAPATRPAPCRR